MKRIFTLTLAILLVALSLNFAFSQCSTVPCPVPTPTNDPAQACILPAPQALNCYLGSTNSLPVIVQPPSWCTSVENNQWFAFTATAATADFEIECLACTSGGGIQAAVLSTPDCVNFAFVSPCLGGINSGTSQTLTATGLIPGEVYYLMLDGQAGAICNYAINGLSNTINGFPLNPCIPSSLSGNYFTEATCSWTITPPGAGVILGSPIGTSVDVNWQTPGTAQLCAANLVCPNLPIDCVTITVGNDVMTQESANLCVGGTTICGGQSFSSPGFFQVTHSSWSGCDSIVNCLINLIPTTNTPMFQAEVCAPDSYDICGQPYFTSGFYTQTCTGYLGCDSIVSVDLAILDPISVIAPPSELGCGNNAEVILDGTGSSFNISIGGTTVFDWTGPSINGPTDQPIALINGPGNYCLEITHERNGLVCTDMTCVDVIQNIEVPDAPLLDGDTLLCEGDTLTYTVTPQGNISNSGYTWTTPNGEDYEEINSTTISIAWNNSTGGNLCVTSDNDCGPSTPTCLNIIVETAPDVPILAGPEDVCDGDVLTYEIINPTAGAVNNWTVPPGASFSVMGDTIEVDFTGASSGDICASSMNDCGTVNSLCLSISLTSDPANPTITGPDEICDGLIGNYCVAQDTNVVDYTWITPADTFPNQTECFDVDWTGLGSGNVCVTAHNICGSSQQICFPVTVNVSPTAEISGGGEYCEGDTDPIDLSVALTGVSPWTLVYSDGVNPAVTINNIMSSPHIIPIAGIAGSYTLVSVNDATDCDGIISGQADIIENPLPTVQLSGNGDICEGSGDMVDLSIDLTGTPNWTVSWTVDGAPQADLNNITSSPFILSIGETQTGDIELVSVIDGNGCENVGDGNVINIALNDAPTVSNIGFSCNGTNTGYTLTFEISGGDPGTYSVTSTIPGIGGSISPTAPYIFTSDLIPSPDGYSFIVTDINDCNPIDVSDDEVFCNCTTEVGTMDLMTIEQCGTDPIMADYDASTEVLDGDDIVEFILHEGSGINIVNAIDTNSVPVFGFHPSMNFGTTYYISAIAGNNIGGHVDQAENCAVVAQGTPIVFHEIPSAFMIGDLIICEGETTGLSIDFTGVGPWSLEYDDGTGPQTINGITNNPFVLDVTPNSNTTYTLTGVSDVNCPGEIDGTITVTVNTAVAITNVNEECNDTGTAFTVSFEITGGDPNSYLVTGLPGSISSTTPYIFTSDLVSGVDNYSVTVDDANSCDPEALQNTVVCDCLTDVGTMDLNAIDECSDGPVLVTYNNSNEFLDADDVLVHVLHTGNLTLGTILQTNIIEPNFGFDANIMDYGTTYYISTIIGNNDGNGMVDLNDPCLAFAQGTPITFFEVPTGELMGQEAICDGEMTNITVNLTGDSPWSITINGQIIDGIVSSPYQYAVNPATTTKYILEAVSDENCTGSFTGSADVTVNFAPTVSNVMVECNPTNTAYRVSFEIDGGDIDCYEISGNPGVLIGNIFTSDEIATGDGYFFLVDDCNECGPIVVEDPEIICDCETLAGDMDGIGEDICGSGPATANYTGGHVLDADDVLCYIIHNGDFVPLAVNPTTPEFTYQPANMTYGQTYFVCAVAGNDDGNGCVDLMDPCVSYSNVCSEVIFYEIPTASLSGGGTICNGESVDLTFTITGGVAPYTIQYEDVVSGNTISELTNDLVHTVNVSPSAGTDFVFVSLEDANCVGSVSGAATAVVNNPPTYQILGETCNDTNTGYTVTIEIFSTSPDLIVNPMGSGVLTGNIFTSNEIDINQNYFFEIDDGFGCGPVLIADSAPECLCITLPGTMSGSLEIACENEPITATHNANEVLDGNDVLGYFLHEQVPSVDYNSALSYSDQPTFSLDPANMQPGLTYLICATAGDDDGNGSPDPNDDCFLISNCTPVYWYPNPTVDIAGTTTICEGQDAQIAFNMTGSPPYQIEYLENGTPQTLNVWGNDTMITVNPIVALDLGLVAITSIIDANTQCFSPAAGNVVIDLSTPGNSGDAASPMALCENENQDINLDLMLLNADPGGQWTDQNNIPIGNIFNTLGQPDGDYTFTYTITPQAPCPEVSTDVLITINPLPVADAGEDQNLNCDDTVGELGGSGTSTGDFSYLWSGGNVSNTTSISTTTSEAGVYNLLVTNTVTGCTAQDEVEVAVDLSAPIPDPSFSDLSCFEANDGFISVGPITGGAPPYLCSINGGAFSDETTFTNLSAGQYVIICRDSKGCEFEMPISIGQPDLLEVDIIGDFIGNDPFVNLGDSVLISLEINLPFDSLDAVIWNPTEAVPCDTCESFYLTPSEQTTLTIEVQDGVCSDSDELTVFVRKNRPVYVPNAFSPNSDGTNDVLQIYSGNSVAKIKSFLVFNRWGETIHEFYDFEPENTDHAWDGYFRGELLNPAVFVWFAEIEFIDGVVEVFEGDVTLVR